MNELSFDERTRAMETRMYRVARSMLRCDADCADAIPNAVFAAWRRLPALRDETRFEQWLMRILVNACRDMQRTYQKRKNDLPLEALDTLQSDPPPDICLRDALQKLPEKYRLPVLLHHMDGYSLADAARILSLPTATVKWRIHVGIKKLRELLLEEEK